jgi:hypothetical protein
MIPALIYSVGGIFEVALACYGAVELPGNNTRVVVLNSAMAALCFGFAVASLWHGR